MKKETIVIHSGGMDSSICLFLAKQAHGSENVISLSYRYNQRHEIELTQAAKIAQTWGIAHHVVDLEILLQAGGTNNALVNSSLIIEHQVGQPPNTLVVGRNGLMVHLAGMYASQWGATSLYTGVMELEVANSGYRDCSRKYMDLQQEILRIDLDCPQFEIRTPLIKMTKLETMELADQLGILPFLLEETVTCYEGIRHWGCQKCPACQLRNEAVKAFFAQHPEKMQKHKAYQ